MAEAESVLVTALETGVSARICTELPSTLPDAIVRITRFGGADDPQFSVYDEPIVDFDCFAPTRAAARTLAHQVRDYVRNTLPGTTVAGAFIISARTVTGPRWTPYDNTNVRRFTYTAQFRIHSI